MVLTRLFDDMPRTTTTSFSSMIDQVVNDITRQQGVARFRPTVDIAETDEAYEVEVGAPGMKKEDFTINVDKNILTISGKRENHNEKKDCHLMESAYGTFERSFTLPEFANVDDIQARYENGILKVHIPKDEKTGRKRNIEIA